MPGLLPVEEMQALRQSLAGIGPRRMIREGVRLLEVLSSEKTLLLVIEDLQWADAGTLDILEAVAVRNVSARLMVLASVRTFDVASEHSQARRLVARLCSRPPQATRLDLEPLTGSSVRAYLEQRFGHPEPETGIAAVLEETSGGNPLFLTALADSLVDSSYLTNTDGSWSLRVAVETLQAELPDSLRETIADRLDLLPAESIETLEAASVAGVELTVAELGAATERAEPDTLHAWGRERFAGAERVTQRRPGVEWHARGRAVDRSSRPPHSFLTGLGGLEVFRSRVERSPVLDSQPGRATPWAEHTHERRTRHGCPLPESCARRCCCRPASRGRSRLCSAVRTPAPARDRAARSW